ncbi:MAG TPA: MaoC family dehydratase N-terminal domain-containing protein [Burkholderiaceae bacterium]|nr:MaoC family dehydratase N-terminal domain-containing protein [Burkholderiaceae bacterium]
MIDRRHIGHSFEPFRVEVEKRRLRFFAEATGETNLVYTDETIAAAAGYGSLPVPPTFLYCLEMEGSHPAAIRDLLGIDYRKILHGEQGFSYHAMAFAGDTLTFSQRLHDIYERKAGALEFVVRHTRVTNQHAELVAELRCVTVVKVLGSVPA